MFREYIKIIWGPLSIDDIQLLLLLVQTNNCMHPLHCQTVNKFQEQCVLHRLRHITMKAAATATANY